MCKDRRFLIKSAGGNLSESIEASCEWSKSFSLMPSDLECVVTYCDNPTTEPNTSGLNYNLEWDGERVPINGSIIYPCLEGHRHEQAVSLKRGATNTTEAWTWTSFPPVYGLSSKFSFQVNCSDSGEFVYPPSWLQCSATVFCPDPGNSSLVSREYTTEVKNLEYNSKLKYGGNIDATLYKV